MKISDDEQDGGQTSEKLSIFTSASVNNCFISTKPESLIVGAVERRAKMFLVSFILILSLVNEDNDVKITVLQMKPG